MHKTAIGNTLDTNWIYIMLQLLLKLNLSTLNALNIKNVEFTHFF